MGGHDERAAVERPHHCALLLPLAHAVVAGHLRIELAHLVERRDDLVLHVVDDVATDADDPIGRLDEDVHRALGVTTGVLDDDARRKLDRPRQLEVEQAHGARGVQPVDVVLDVLRRILLAHQAGDRVLELLALHDDGRRHREPVVLPRVVDVVVGVQDVADVLGLETVLCELIFQLLLLADPAGHAEPLHDLRVGRTGVHEDGVVAAQDERAPGLRPGLLPHVAGQNQEARLELDVDQVEELYLESHGWRLL